MCHRKPHRAAQRHDAPMTHRSRGSTPHAELRARLEPIAAEMRGSTVEARDAVLLLHLVAAWPTTQAQTN